MPPLSGGSSDKAQSAALIRRRPISLRFGQFRMQWKDRWSREGRIERREVAQAIVLTDLPRGPRVNGSVWAVTMVRDELDVIPSVLDHLLEQGVDGIIVADNMSQDGTWEYLKSRADREPRLHVGRDTMFAYKQALKMTRLAELATRAGADWIVPFDADEYWFAPEGELASWLRQRDADVVEADWYDMVLSSGLPITSESAFLMDSTPSELRKVAFRSLPAATLGIGNHTVRRLGDRSVERLKVAHARWRSFEQISRKVRQGAAAMAATGRTDYGTHWSQAAALEDDEIERMWADLLAGHPVEALHWSVRGPMRHIQPLTWSVWDVAATEKPERE